MTGRTHALDLVPGLRELAQAQLGVVRRDQLAELGVTRHHVRRQVLAERWTTIGPRAVVLSTGPMTPVQRWCVATAHAGRWSALAGMSTLEHRGLAGWRRSLVHVMVPHGKPPTPLPWIAVHQASHVAPHDVDSQTWPPCASAARAAVDAARWQPSEDTAAGLVLAVVQQRLADVPSILEVLDRLPRVRHGARIHEALRHAQAGADSLGEIDVFELLRQVGLEAPRRQVLVRTPSGVRRADLAVELPDGQTLVVEVDGPTHEDHAVRLADAEKDAAFIAAGCLLLRIPWTGGRRRREQVRAQLQAIVDAAFARASA